MIVDSHVHAAIEPDITKEFRICDEDLDKILVHHQDEFQRYQIDLALVYVLDARVWNNCVSIPENIIIGAPLSQNYYLDDLKKKQKYKVIKILPYEQGLKSEQYDSILDMVIYASACGKVVSICSTYGGKRFRDINGVDLACSLVKDTDATLILAHGGGPKIFDAMTLALEYDNVFLDLSFSLKYWRGSTVLQDYAFAIKKLDGKKVFYGSDYPYVSFNDALNYFYLFSHRYGLERYNEKMLSQNFLDFKEKYFK